MKRFWTTLCLAIAAVATLSCNGKAQRPAVAPAGPPQRIVSVAPSATEILFAIGAGDRVVGRTDWCVRPKAAQPLPSIGGYSTPSLEAVLALQPDCVVYVPSIVRDAPAFAQAMEAAGARVVPVEMAGIESAIATITELGKATGAEQHAGALAAQLRRDLAEATAAFTGKGAPRVLVTLSHEPHALFVAGRGTFIAELLELTGARNAAQADGYFAISAEALLAAAPDVIIDAAGPMENPVRAAAASKRLWARFADLPAVKAKRVHLITDAAVIVPGPRMADAVRLFGSLVHGAEREGGK
jgi:iron complex transport system substrate-binding protein